MPSSATKKGGCGSSSGGSTRGGLSTPSPSSKGGGRWAMTTPSSSGNKKKQQQQQEEVVPTDQLDDVLLRHAPASSPSPPDRLLLAPLDCRRLGVKAGDWVVVLSSPSSPSSPSSGNECQTPPRGRKRSRVVVLRAWPGSSGPSGAAAGAGPFILGQFPHFQEAGRECFVSIRALSGSVRRVAAIEVALRLVPPAEEEGGEGDTERKATRPTVSCGGAAAAVLWKARLKDVLVGHLIYPGLRLTFASFAARATFEVVKVRAVEEEEETSSCQGNEEDESVALPDLAALSLAEKDSNNEGHCGTAQRLLYQVGRHTRLRVVDRPSGEEFKEEKLKVETKEDAQEDEEDCWVTVGGLQAAVQEVREGVEQALDSPEVFAQQGLRPTRGLLLVGASGTGKTTLLRAAAQYFAYCKGYHVMRLGGPELVGRLVGETESNLRQAFEEAKARAPTVMVLDEVEALCLRRDAASSDLDKRMVATFLALMDGFQGMERVVVLAATSRPQAVDPAVRRPGRLDREVDVGVPGEAARKDILKVLLQQAGPTTMRVSEEDVQMVASRAHGFVGADLLLVCKEAAMLAARRVGKHLAPAEKDGNQQGENLRVTGEDLLAGLARVRPSALREVAVEVPRVRWGDIGGMGDVKRALQECVEWPLTRPEAFVRMGIAPPKGVLLYGPPGCSKTLMARALATESGMNFLAVKGPELLSKWLGESEKALQALFKKARAAAPTVIFFDEVDALAGRRGEGEDSKASERVLSQLLMELDGVQPLRRVVVVAATNRPDLLDPALLRPGRIDRKVYVPPPDTPSRREILTIALRGMPVEDMGAKRGEGGSEGLGLDDVARRTEGFSGAEMVALCREAALCAVEEDPVNARCLQGRHLDQVLTGWQRQITPQMLDFYRRYADGR